MNATTDKAAETRRIELPSILNDEQIDRYLNDGYIVVEGLLKGEEVEELKRELVEVARGKYPSDNFQPLPAEIPDEEVLANILAIHHPHLISPMIEACARHPKICGVLAQIVGAHLSHWDGSVKEADYVVRQAAGLPGAGLAPGRTLHPDAGPVADRGLDRHR